MSDEKRDDGIDEPTGADMPNIGKNVREHLLDQEMKESYLSYAMSVIIQRALPDVRDGLKPSQRRILVAMNDLNLGPRSKYRKCAKIVGDTTGNYHPHGDQAVYPTLVRLAQGFNMRYQLIEPQGNFGYVDGSPPAAMRYTEARMASPAVDLLDDIEKETVDFVPNYDDTRLEPTVLPGRFPNLLCNGSQGIAVGMATSIPPHNVSEICDAIIAYIRNPAMTLSEAMEIVPGPDFPTGGIICGRTGILRAFTSGRGLITVRGKVTIEQKRGDRECIAITELPYQVNPNTIIEKLKILLSEGTIKGVTNVNDETDRKAGLRLVVDVKRGENSELIVNQLYKHTPLQSTFSINMLALDNGRPRTFGILDLLRAYRDHRVEVIQRRTRHLLRKAQERCHIVEGLRIAVANIDEVVRIIKESANPEAARDALMAAFELSKRQADAILAMRLARLTGLEIEKLEAEYNELLERIAYYKSILADIGLVHDMIVEDVEVLKERFGDKRRTAIQLIDVDIEDESLIPDDPMVVTLSHSGYVKRTSLEAYRSQGRGGKGVTAADLKEGDFLERIIVAANKDYFLFFTDRGRLLWLKVYQIPELSRQSRGRAMVNLLGLQEGEVVTSIIPVRELDDDNRFLVMVTEGGIIKKTALSAFSNVRTNGIIACTLAEGDRLRRAVITDGDDEVVVTTAMGQAIRFNENNVRPMGRTARGVRAVKLRDEDRVVGMLLAGGEGATFLTVCEKGYGKRTDFDQYRVQGRGGFGIRNIKTPPRNGPVVATLAVTEDDEIILISEKGMIVRTRAAEISHVGRDTQGVRIMGLKKEDRIVSCALVAKDLADASAGPELEDEEGAESTVEGGAASAEATASTSMTDGDANDAVSVDGDETDATTDDESSS